MQSRGRVRLFLSLFYLGAVFLAAGYLYHRIQWFEGKICIEKGKAEHVAVRESNPDAGIFAEERTLPLELIAFNNPAAARACFNPKTVYDAAVLPFYLHLDDVVVLQERPAHEILEVTCQGRKTEFPVTPGGRFPLGNDTGAILGVQRWTGLLSHSPGQPMAAISYYPPGDPSGEPSFLARGVWRMTAKAMALYLDCFENEALAREMLPQALPGLQSARWGIAEGGNTHWFNSFAPGTAMTLNDGTEVTLLRYEERRASLDGELPALLFSVKQNGNTEEGWVYANNASKDGSIRFDYPGRCESVLFVHAWRDGEAWIAAFHQGRHCGQIKLKEKQSWTPGPAFPYEVRLDQFLQQAVFVGHDSAPVQALSIQLPGGVIHLREGESHAGQGFRIHYRKQPQAPMVRYVLSIRENGTVRQYLLSPEGSFRHGFWRFRQDPGNPRAANTAVLLAERTLGGYAQLLGAIMLITGAFGWVLIRLWK